MNFKMLIIKLAYSMLSDIFNPAKPEKCSKFRLLLRPYINYN